MGSTRNGPGDNGAVEPFTEERFSSLAAFTLHLAARFAPSSDEAEDIAQEAILALIRCGCGVERHEAWLRVVVQHLAISQARARRRREAMSPAGAGSTNPFPSKDRELDLRRALARVPPRTRLLVLLSLRGFRQREIAAVLGCSTKAIGTMLRRAHARVRQALDERP